MIKLKFLFFVIFAIKAELTANAYQRYLVDRMEDNQETTFRIRFLPLLNETFGDVYLWSVMVF